MKQVRQTAMNTQAIKTRLIGALGEKSVAYLQALRFIYILMTKQKPDPEVSLLPALIGPGDTTIDVGANGANWTYWLHRVVGNDGFVFAFEADPYYARATELAISMMRLKGVRLFPFGLSDSNEEAPLRVADADGSRLSGLSHIDRNADRQGSGVSVVKLKRLDSLLNDHPRLTATKLIKCDVEGYELFVFRGAVELLERSRPFVILEAGNSELQGYPPHELVEFFSRKDYAPYAMTGENILAPTDPSMNHAEALSVNRVFIPHERRAPLLDRIRILA